MIEKKNQEEKIHCSLEILKTLKTLKNVSLKSYSPPNIGLQNTLCWIQNSKSDIYPFSTKVIKPTDTNLAQKLGIEKKNV